MIGLQEHRSSSGILYTHRCFILAECFLGNGFEMQRQDHLDRCEDYGVFLLPTELGTSMPRPSLSRKYYPGSLERVGTAEIHLGNLFANQKILN